MWFVNIDHWTIKLAYLALKKITDDTPEINNQVDIYKVIKVRNAQLALSSILRFVGFTLFKSIPFFFY